MYAYVHSVVTGLHGATKGETPNTVIYSEVIQVIIHKTDKFHTQSTMANKSTWYMQIQGNPNNPAKHRTRFMDKSRNVAVTLTQLCND